MDTKEIAACMGEMMTMMTMTMIFFMTMVIITMTLVMTNMVTKIILTMMMSISMIWTPRRLPPAWVK